MVTFAGRESELADLARWRDQAAPALSARLLHGVAGAGKTRLASEFARQSQERHSIVLTAHYEAAGRLSAAPVAVPADSPAVGESPGLLIVVDYADRWPHSHLTG